MGGGKFLEGKNTATRDFHFGRGELFVALDITLGDLVFEGFRVWHQGYSSRKMQSRLTVVKFSSPVFV